MCAAGLAQVEAILQERGNYEAWKESLPVSRVLDGISLVIMLEPLQLIPSSWKIETMRADNYATTTKSATSD